MGIRPAAALLVCTFLCAPPARAGDLWLTLRGGAAFSKLTDSSPADFGFRTAPVGGVALSIPLGGDLRIEPEVGYAQRGTSLGHSEQTDSQGNVLGTFETVLQQDMLTFTVPVRYTIPLSSTVRLGLLGGPSLAFEMHERLVADGGPIGSQDTVLLEDTDFDAVVGGGLDFRLGPGRLSAEGRFVLGWIPLFGSGTSGGQTRSAEATVAYSFPLGH